MKQGWEIKKLGEVCEINPSKKEAIKKLELNDKVSFLPMEDLGINAYYITPSQERSLSEVLSSYTYFADGDVLLAKVSPCFENGKIGIANNLTNGVGFGSSEYLTFRLGKDIVKEFLYFYLQNKTFVKEATKNLTGTSGLRRVPTSFVESCKIPCPPIEEQEKIVEELDCLSGVIEKKKQQLKELDALAESIFYTMFGDPITNEKGWEVKPLKEFGEVITGNTPSTKDEENFSSNDYCFVKPSDIDKDCITHIKNTENYISKKAFLQSRQLKIGSVLTTCIGIIGKVGILQTDATCNQQINAIIPNSNYTSDYIAFAIYLSRKVIEDIANAPVVPIINKSAFSNITIPSPPLSLQQEFAEKIEAIEKQKQLIKKSIEETETLFNARMDYYFN